MRAAAAEVLRTQGRGGLMAAALVRGRPVVGLRAGTACRDRVEHALLGRL
ncbi:hypothetical protein [Pseudonocardia acidicola]|uniref:Uncharacterized protein n=1 Tax=Pseudonocardia acidicola TaxID=2724939 RepID=A0ABX1SK55_9PSEU|nr:hypothetical protein [Pseudonocardia acidicola]NMI00772.1 hypothetical protein [Pseudonocardia acidicola]